jgi:hypothetical protein
MSGLNKVALLGNVPSAAQTVLRFRFAYRREVASAYVLGYFGAPPAAESLNQRRATQDRPSQDPLESRDYSSAAMGVRMMHVPIMTGLMTSDARRLLAADPETVLVAFEDAGDAKLVARQASIWNGQPPTQDSAGEASETAGEAPETAGEASETAGEAPETAEARYREWHVLGGGDYSDSELGEWYKKGLKSSDSSENLESSEGDTGVSATLMDVDEAKKLGIMMGLPLLLLLSGTEEATFYRL